MCHFWRAQHPAVVILFCLHNDKDKEYVRAMNTILKSIYVLLDFTMKASRSEW